MYNYFVNKYIAISSRKITFKWLTNLLSINRGADGHFDVETLSTGLTNIFADIADGYVRADPKSFNALINGAKTINMQIVGTDHIENVLSLPIAEGAVKDIDIEIAGEEYIKNVFALTMLAIEDLSFNMEVPIMRFPDATPLNISEIALSILESPADKIVLGETLSDTETANILDEIDNLSSVFNTDTLSSSIIDSVEEEKANILARLVPSIFIINTLRMLENDSLSSLEDDSLEYIDKHEIEI